MRDMKYCPYVGWSYSNVYPFLLHITYCFAGFSTWELRNVLWWERDWQDLLKAHCSTRIMQSAIVSWTNKCSSLNIINYNKIMVEFSYNILCPPSYKLEKKNTNSCSKVMPSFLLWFCRIWWYSSRSHITLISPHGCTGLKVKCKHWIWVDPGVHGKMTLGLSSHSTVSSEQS